MSVCKTCYDMCSCKLTRCINSLHLESCNRHVILGEQTNSVVAVVNMNMFQLPNTAQIARLRMGSHVGMSLIFLTAISGETAAFHTCIYL